MPTVGGKCGDHSILDLIEFKAGGIGRLYEEQEMSEENKCVYFIDESSVDVRRLDEMLSNLGPGSIILAEPGLRIMELHPDRPARVITFDGIIEEPNAEAESEHGSKFMLTDEGLKKV